MKKHLSFLLLFSFIFLLFGCQSASKHYIEENESYYLEIDNLPTVPSNEDIGAIVELLPASIAFDSIDEMCKRIRNADFDEGELREIARFDQDSKGRILMFDLSKIYVPYHPSAITDYKVIWHGDTYHYDISSDMGHISMWSYESIEEMIKAYESSFPENGYYETKEMRQQARTFSDAEATYYIIETYRYWVSNEFPRSVSVFVERNNQYFGIKLSGLQGPVTDEFLTQFEYRLYTPPAMPLWQKIAIGAGVAVVVAGIITTGILLRKRSLRRKYAYFNIDV